MAWVQPARSENRAGLGARRRRVLRPYAKGHTGERRYSREARIRYN